MFTRQPPQSPPACAAVLAAWAVGGLACGGLTGGEIADPRARPSPPADPVAPTGAGDHTPSPVPGPGGGGAGVPPAAPCGLSLIPAGPYFLEETDTLTISVRCASGAPPSAVRIAALPSGASYDADEGTLRWTPRLDQAGVHALTLSLPGAAESTALRVAVADRFDHPDNVAPAAPAEYQEETGLPVLHLHTDPAIHPDDYTPAGLVYRGRSYRIEAKYRGSSSLEYPKKHFTLKFAKADPFGDPDRGGPGGFVGKRKLVLNSGFDDNSHVRQRLSFEAWNRLDAGKIRIQHFPAVVYLNGAYHGLYTVTDHIDGDLMAAHGLDPNANLFKAIGNEANFTIQATLPALYEKKEGLPPAGQPGAFDDLAELTRFVALSAADVFRRELPMRVDLRDYRAWYIAATAIGAQDTMGKNAYHYHDPATGRWRAVVWDFNHSWGQAWTTHRVTAMPLPEQMAADAANQLFTRLVGDRVLGAEVRARYGAAIRDELGRAAMLALLDEFAAAVARSTPRDERRWRAQHRAFHRWADRRDFTDSAGEVDYIRTWIAQRWTALEQRYPAR